MQGHELLGFAGAGMVAPVIFMVDAFVVGETSDLHRGSTAEAVIVADQPHIPFDAPIMAGDQDGRFESAGVEDP